MAANSHDKHIIKLSQDDLQAKFHSEGWAERFSPHDCQTTEKKASFDNWRTTTIIKRKTCYNKVTGHRATIREFTKDGKSRKVVLVLEDDTAKYVYNGIPAAV